MKIGIGYDVHRLVEGRDLILGGVKIDFNKGLDGHSDADVLCHAISDALLGAAKLGDIGQLFPDTDNRYKDANSIELLKSIVDKINNKGFIVEDVDSVIIAQQPKMAPHIEQMRNNLAAAINVDIDRIGVKATTTEQLGYEGRQEGISAKAVCILKTK